MRQGEKDTRKRILDCAEKLFARDGYHCTTLRAITKKARANLAAVNYHFGSKEELLKEVIERRLVPLNEERIKSLEAVSDAAANEKRRPEVEEVLLAFIEPTFTFRDSGEGSRDFITLVGRSFSEPDGTVRGIFMQLIGPVFGLYSNLLSHALPEVPEEVFKWRLHFAIGAMAHIMHVSCSDCHQELKTAINTEDLVAMYIDFFAAGMKAPL